MLAGQVQGASQEAGHFSDTTASAGASDDEGSTAATDGSTLRTSPAEQVTYNETHCSMKRVIVSDIAHINFICAHKSIVNLCNHIYIFLFLN